MAMTTGSSGGAMGDINVTLMIDIPSGSVDHLYGHRAGYAKGRWMPWCRSRLSIPQQTPPQNDRTIVVQVDTAQVRLLSTRSTRRMLTSLTCFQS